MPAAQKPRPARSTEGNQPEEHTRARKFNFASFGAGMKDRQTLRFSVGSATRTCEPGRLPCLRLQIQVLLYLIPPRCRIPLAREPLGKRVPAASSQTSKTFGGPVY